jgi:hypothetical protein
MEERKGGGGDRGQGRDQTGCMGGRREKTGRKALEIVNRKTCSVV